MLDDIDRKILEILQADGRTTNVELARRIGMAPSAAFERVRRLEQRGVITGYAARVNPRAVDRPLLAYVLVRSDERIGTSSSGEALARFPEVLEVHHVAGQDSYLVKVRVKDPEALGKLLRDRFGAIESVRSTQSIIALDTFKDTWALSIDTPVRPEKARG
jgi:Lrp/AsnC family transcriptional regulator, leucine-responsive regulatory protein